MSIREAGEPRRDHSLFEHGLLRTAALCTAGGRTGGRPHQGSARSSLARVFAGTSRVSTSVPELVIVDFVAEHAEQPQDEFAGHGDESDGRIFSSFGAEVEAAEVFK